MNQAKVSTHSHSLLADLLGKTKVARPPWFYKSLDAVLTAHLRAPQPPAANLKTIFQLRGANYHRVAAVVNLLDGIRPGLAQRLSKRLVRLESFPLAGYRVSPLAYGSGATVFLLKNGHEAKVLKFYRRSLAQTSAQALEIGREFQAKHRRLKNWFNRTTEIVIPSDFLVLHSPLLGVHSAALIQPYIAEKKKDLFDYSDGELVALAQQHPLFGRQLEQFIEQILFVFKYENVCFDMAGYENLMVVATAEGPRLKIADNGILDICFIKEKAPKLYSLVKQRLRRLRGLQLALEEQHSHHPAA